MPGAARHSSTLLARCLMLAVGRIAALLGAGLQAESAGKP
ncbi:hypothetical protein C4K39_0366 [Pseudomonas sessilinigenes]|nr:hypothetical protein C4K39_0366 [Pseudomonas sessilinigenes]